jgi:hypothetical protein
VLPVQLSETCPLAAAAVKAAGADGIFGDPPLLLARPPSSQPMIPINKKAIINPKKFLMNNLLAGEDAACGQHRLFTRLVNFHEICDECALRGDEGAWAGAVPC